MTAPPRGWSSTIRILTEAMLFGLMGVVLVIVWGLVLRKNLAGADYAVLVPAFFVAGAVIYAAGEGIAGRMTGSFAGAILGLFGAGWLAQQVAAGAETPLASRIWPAVGFVAGAVLGAVAERALRGKRSSSGTDEHPAPAQDPTSPPKNHHE